MFIDSAFGFKINSLEEYINVIVDKITILETNEIISTQELIKIIDKNLKDYTYKDTIIFRLSNIIEKHSSVKIEKYIFFKKYGLHYTLSDALTDFDSKIFWYGNIKIGKPVKDYYMLYIADIIGDGEIDEDCNFVTESYDVDVKILNELNSFVKNLMRDGKININRIKYSMCISRVID